MAASPETTIPAKRAWFGDRPLFAIWTAVFVGVMAWNWAVGPHASFTFGPFWLLRSRGLDLCSGLGLLILLPILFVFPARPNVFTAIVSAAGILLWCAIGALAQLPVPVVATPKTAYTDGFQVVVLDLAEGGTVASVRSVPLAEAEQATFEDRTALLLPSDETAVAEMLERAEGRKGDFTVHVSVERVSTDKQKVRTSFHYSMRTYYYEYEVAGRTVTPLESGYRDLARSSAVRYSDR